MVTYSFHLLAKWVLIKTIQLLQANRVKAIHKARDPTGYGGQSSYGSDNGATNYGSNGHENYGSSGSNGNRGYGDNQYEKNAAVYASDICKNPAIDAAMEKAQQCGKPLNLY